MLKWKRDQIEHLITRIQQNPCIYNVKCIEYLDRAKKTLAFNSILHEMQKMESNFTLYEIKRKWKNLRTQYAQELRAINLAKKSGNKYEAKLWCFKQLEFIEQHMEMRTNKDTTEPNRFPKVIKREKPNIVNSDELLELPTKRMKKSDDYSQTLANVWASEFSLASEDQQFFAKKAIDDILFEARLGTLHRNSVKINSPETYNAYDSNLEPTRITSSPNRCMSSQTAYPKYIIHLPSQPKSSYNPTHYNNSSYTENNEHVPLEPEITIHSE